MTAPPHPGTLVDLDADGTALIPQALPQHAEWPRVGSLVPRDEAVERRVGELLATMSLAEKVGQLTQPEIQSITPDEVRDHHIGSILNGGGSWPGRDRNAAPADWLAAADAYWQASLDGSSAGIPLVWGIDAVRGHTHALGATLFPHNIGLGAARNPRLVREIGAATAVQTRATGHDWVFAPCLAVPQDYRWGRTYEGYTADPGVVLAYGYESVIGLQGDSAGGPAGDRVIATAKHYIGDGATTGGGDQGVAAVSEDVMRNVHAQGYYGALAAGAQTVMASFNSWDSPEHGIREGKLHGSHYALTTILKERLGFDGVVVSDWNGVGQVDGCTNASCARSINAGIDIVMVPTDWKPFIRNTIAQVESGEIPMSRIDDAVSRILRVKIRAGVLDAPKPSQRPHAGEAAALQHRELARRAVRESLVLLKDDRDVLPLPRTARVLVVGKSADSVPNQCGGWARTWQGTDTTNDDFPTATTVLGGLREVLGEAAVTFAETAEGVDVAAHDAVVAVIGETPYAEGYGDLARRSLAARHLHPEDLEVLDRVSARGVPVVTVYFSGRPLCVNAELNRSDAFVAAWLPGTEGGGVADLLVDTGHAFTGALPFSWPRSACPTDGEEPLFPIGQGLAYAGGARLGVLDEDVAPRCLGTGGIEDLELFERRTVEPFRAFVGAPDGSGRTEIGNDVNVVTQDGAVTVRTSDVNLQQDARRVTWDGSAPWYFALQGPTGGTDLSRYREADGAIVFDTKLFEPPTDAVTLGVRDASGHSSLVDVTEALRRLPVGHKSTVKVPLAALDDGRLDFTRVEVPILVGTAGRLDAAFASVRWAPEAGADEDAVTGVPVG